jgi:phosphatidylglycerol:prolipoprotein diacylglycerol transferase
MFPTVQIGPAAVQTSVLALILALWLGTAIAERECKRRGLSGDNAWMVVTIAVAATIIFARLIYVAQNFTAYASDWREIFSLTSGTLSLDYGAVFGLVVALAYVQRRKIPLAQFADALAPGALVALAIVALGQFLSGDAYGAPAELPWAIELYGESRHPVQLYDAIAALIGVIVIWRAARKQLADGSIALLTTAWASGARVLTEAFRGDAAILPGGYRSAQIIGLIVLLLALLLMSRLSTRKEKPDGKDANAQI